MEFWGGGWIYAPDYYPTGDELWSCTGSGAGVQYAGSNSGGYCDPQAQADIIATEPATPFGDVHVRGLSRQATPGHLDARAYAQLSEINKDLKGTGPQDPLLQIYPENWRWS